MAATRSPFLGIEQNAVPDLPEAVNSVRQGGFDFLVLPLVHPRYRRTSAITRDEPFTRSDMLLGSEEWSSSVVGKLSRWLNFDSPNSVIRKDSELAFKQEMAWASHLALPAVLLPTPSFCSPNYARLLNQVLVGTYVRYESWIRIPLMAGNVEGSSSGRPHGDSWEWWNNLRALCDHSSLMGVVLEITANLPSDKALARWFGEPIKAVILPTSVFVTNEMGFPVLTRKHQEFVVRLFEKNIQIIFSGKPTRGEGIRHFKDYILNLHTNRYARRLTQQDQFEMPFRDYLQTPLQPLMDNLESSTYETFERDPIKYAKYQEAITKALYTLHSEDQTTVVMVVGAGRGPLVKCALNASKMSGRPIRVYAIEKNPNAVVTLRNMHTSLGWGGKVTVVAVDMRDWNAPEKADIIVSELLGSFGDNELSPECLDGAQKYLKDSGISIPSAYTSYIAPISTPKLHNDVKSFRDLAHFETGYVVKLHSFFSLADPASCFTFTHPNRQVPIDNNRSTRMTFHVELAATMHGFVGYFDATLFDDVHISIHPDTHSPGMFSWYPIYFPIKNPLYVPSGSTVEVHFWRIGNKSKVWYEWCISQPDTSAIHNPNGRSHFIGL